MAGTSIKIDASNFRGHINDLLARIADVRDVLPDIGEELLQSTDTRFRQEKAPDGTPWAPLSPVTLAQKKRRPPHILKEEGLRGGLRGSINYQVKGETLALGSPLPYARIHQLGGQAGRNRKVTIPARPYLGVSKDDEAEIRDIVADHLGLE